MFKSPHWGSKEQKKIYVCDVCEGMVHLTDSTSYWWYILPTALNLLTDLDIRYKKIYMEEV